MVVSVVGAAAAAGVLGCCLALNRAIKLPSWAAGIGTASPICVA